MKFIADIVNKIMQYEGDPASLTVVLPNKRPAIFIRKELVERNCQGILPHIISVQDFMEQQSGGIRVDGIRLWLLAYEVYNAMGFSDSGDLSGFLKWFPTLLNDWNDMLKYHLHDRDIIENLYAEERIRQWADQLESAPDHAPRKKFLRFWQNASKFLPKLREKLETEGLMTDGMAQLAALKNFFAPTGDDTTYFLFCGFNAMNTCERTIIKNLISAGRADILFQADHYYLDDTRQEAGHFLREYRGWKEFHAGRPFGNVYSDFAEPKDITVYEIAGNAAQTELLRNLLTAELQNENFVGEETAVVLLDEVLLPATLDALAEVPYLNITMGFSIKMLPFSTAIRQLFYLQNSLHRKKRYYHQDIFKILDTVPASDRDREFFKQFRSAVEGRNMVYLSEHQMTDFLGQTSVYPLLVKIDNPRAYLDALQTFMEDILSVVTDDITYETIAAFQKNIRILDNFLAETTLTISIENLEQFVFQLINTEKINFEGEPVKGIQIMGLLETRLLNFKNIILLSANEGKLPAGNHQNTFIPFDIRQHFGLPTYQENDAIFAYHFYRLLQDAQKISLCYNALTTGLNTGEKSRFITQLELECSQHQIKHQTVEITGDMPCDVQVVIPKTPLVIQRLEEWSQRISASDLTAFLYDPIQFYQRRILGSDELIEIEEELSTRTYGTLIHEVLEDFYTPLLNKFLTVQDLTVSKEEISQQVDIQLEKLKHDRENFKTGSNYLHRVIAERVIEKMIAYDRAMVEAGHQLRVLDVERKFTDIPFTYHSATLDGERTVIFRGKIDRIDELDGQLRIIDYKTGTPKDLKLKIKPENAEQYFLKHDMSYAIQLILYRYALEKEQWYPHRESLSGIWSFSATGTGVQPLDYNNLPLRTVMQSLSALIEKIMDPNIPFSVDPPKIIEE